MEIGKVPNELLEKLVFGNIAYKRDEVLTRASIGEDTGVIDLGDNLCVVSTDPITGATKELGGLAIHVSCNDAATKGAEPVAILLTILCPENTTEEQLEFVMKQAGEAAKSVNVEIIGGHTEITDAVNRMILSTTVIAKMKREDFIGYEDISIGDKIVLSKWIGLEGTHILGSELRDKLKDKLTYEEIEEAISLGKYLSVVKEGLIAKEYGVKYMHDVTEGGIYGAIWETGKAIGRGIDLFEDKLPIKPITEKLCDILSIDVKKLISSGSMVMVVPEKNTSSFIDRLEKEGVFASVIGVTTEKGIFTLTEAGKHEIFSPATDELYKALEL
ncbi:MAG: AIR synthase family protein [Gudongella sp.]|nr:AIR synthase family protein [Gudongella sp.]